LLFVLEFHKIESGKCGSDSDCVWCSDSPFHYNYSLRGYHFLLESTTNQLRNIYEILPCGIKESEIDKFNTSPCNSNLTSDSSICFCQNDTATMRCGVIEKFDQNTQFVAAEPGVLVLDYVGEKCWFSRDEQFQQFRIRVVYFCAELGPDELRDYSSVTSNPPDAFCQKNISSCNRCFIITDQSLCPYFAAKLMITTSYWYFYGGMKVELSMINWPVQNVSSISIIIDGKTELMIMHWEEEILVRIKWNTTSIHDLFVNLTLDSGIVVSSNSVKIEFSETRSTITEEAISVLPIVTSIITGLTILVCLVRFCWRRYKSKKNKYKFTKINLDEIQLD